jgi:conserved oligomeric Golgi complex subunit 5
VTRILLQVALLDGPTDTAGPVGGPFSTAIDTATSTASAEIPLRSLNAVSAHVPFIEDARVRVTTEMENMVLTGLSTLVRTGNFSLYPRK